jgi:hypothetical protein
LAGHSKLPNHHGDEGGEHCKLEKLGFGENKIKLIMPIG